MPWCDLRQKLQCIFQLNHLVNSNFIWTCNEFCCILDIWLNYVCAALLLFLSSLKPEKLILKNSIKIIISEKVILFVSDGRPTDRNTTAESKEEILRIISQQNALLRNEVIIQTFGIGDGKIAHSILHLDYLLSAALFETSSCGKISDFIIMHLFGTFLTNSCTPKAEAKRKSLWQYKQD